MSHHRPALIRRGWLCGVAAGVVALLFASVTGQAQQRAGGAAASGVSVDRGKYLVNITGCHASAERVVQVDEDRSNRIFFRLRTSSSLTRVAR